MSKLSGLIKIKVFDEFDNPIHKFKGKPSEVINIIKLIKKKFG